jgi:GR25 family glycosyltransferase involved in LPS biosynthesis
MIFPIYCINLKERLDRKKHSLNEFNKININYKNVIYLDFYRDQRGGIYGCYDSHMKVWQDFYKKYKNKDICIVFEDDFETNKKSEELLYNGIKFVLKNINKIDILFLHNICITPFSLKNGKILDVLMLIAMTYQILPPIYFDHIHPNTILNI